MTAQQTIKLYKQINEIAEKIHWSRYGNPKEDKNKSHFGICRQLACKQLGII